MGCKFQDVRHGKRMRQLLDQLSGNIGATTPRACQFACPMRGDLSFRGVMNLDDNSPNRTFSG
jgi:hypothetical protein